MRYAGLFAEHQALLASHRGWDPGALPLARFLARALSATLVSSTVSRLLVELNRSPHHRQLFSEITRRLPAGEREAILNRWYRPYRERVEKLVAKGVRERGWVVHLSVHSFTPVLGGRVREVDIGLLYDPSRSLESTLCRSLTRELRRCLEASTPPLRVRRNRPYRGTADGLTTHLRRRFLDVCYAGIELEVGQSVLLSNDGREALIRKALAELLARVLTRGTDPGLPTPVGH